MDLNSNGVKAVAALVALNAGLLIAHHAPAVTRMHAPAARAAVVSAKAQSCAARQAAARARLQARAVVREMVKAQAQAKQDMHRTAGMAPTSSVPRSCTALNDYVRSLVSLSARSLNAGS